MNWIILAYPQKYSSSQMCINWKMNLFEVWNKGWKSYELLANLFSPYSLSNYMIRCVMSCRFGKWTVLLVALLIFYTSWSILWVHNFGFWPQGWYNLHWRWILVFKRKNKWSCFLWEMFCFDIAWTASSSSFE